MVAPVAIAGGKKAADNPGAAVFLAVLAGAVLIQGVKNLPSLLPKLPGAAIVTTPYKWTREAIETTAALNDEVLGGINQISEKGQDPVERFFFEDDLSAEVYGPGEMGAVHKAYVGARGGLFTGVFNRGWFY